MRSRIEKAREVLGLSRVESIASVKRKFREKFKKGGDVRELISAYRFIVSLMEEYPISLEDIENKRPEEVLKRRFSEDWLSGRGGR